MILQRPIQDCLPVRHVPFDAHQLYLLHLERTDNTQFEAQNAEHKTFAANNQYKMSVLGVYNQYLFGLATEVQRVPDLLVNSSLVLPLFLL